MELGDGMGPMAFLAHDRLGHEAACIDQVIEAVVEDLAQKTVFYTRLGTPPERTVRLPPTALGTLPSQFAEATGGWTGTLSSPLANEICKEPALAEVMGH